jgi:hypothetical protein
VFYTPETRVRTLQLDLEHRNIGLERVNPGLEHRDFGLEGVDVGLERGDFGLEGINIDYMLLGHCLVLQNEG